MSMTSAIAVGCALGLGNAAHCAAMCGPLAFHAAGASTTGSRTRRTAGFIAGKATTYAFIGAIAGRVGEATHHASSGWSVGLSIAAATFVIAGGLLWMLGSALPAAGAVSRLVARGVSGMLNTPALSSGFALGAAAGLLPCGALWLAAAQAAATSEAIRGVALMVTFGLATGPALMASALMGRSLLHKLAPGRLRVIGALVVIATGVITLARVIVPLLNDDGAPACCH